MPDQRFQMGALVVEKATRCASLGHVRLQLGDRTFDALLALIEAAPSSLSKASLADQVWPGQSVSDETISQRVSLVRKALKEAGPNAPIVKNIHGRGYVLAMDEPVEKTRPSLALLPLGSALGRNLHWFAAAAVILVGLFIIGAGSVKQEPVRILVDDTNGALWMGRAQNVRHPYPVQATIEGRSVLINSLVTVEDVSRSPIGLRVYCELARDPDLFGTAIPEDLSVALHQARASRFC